MQSQLCGPGTELYDNESERIGTVAHILRSHLPLYLRCSHLTEESDEDGQPLAAHMTACVVDGWVRTACICFVGLLSFREMHQQLCVGETYIQATHCCQSWWPRCSHVLQQQTSDRDHSPVCISFGTSSSTAMIDPGVSIVDVAILVGEAELSLRHMLRCNASWRSCRGDGWELMLPGLCIEQLGSIIR